MKILFKTFILTIFICFAHFSAAENKDYLIIYSKNIRGQEMKGYMTHDGEVVIEAKYRIAETDKMYSMAIVLKDDGQWVGIDREENIILYPFIYDNGPDYVFEGLFRFVENDKIGFTDLDGNKIIAAEFDFADSFKEGLSEFAYGGHKEYDYVNEYWTWTGATETGYINKYGQKFIRIIKTNDGQRVAWSRNGKRYYIDKDAKIIKEIDIIGEEDKTETGGSQIKIKAEKHKQ
ncbi:MAG: WG repeat-containing protein [Endomicrobium sp.]|jgi:hypothetical protein|nr:WG repeat-containing protein [Endomicrobium sp.]